MRSVSRHLFVVACSAACLALAQTAQAQQNSLFGGSGPMSGASGFSTSSTGSSFGSFGSGMQSGGFPSPSFPGSGTGLAGTGGAGMGITGNMMQQGMGAGGQRFVGQQTQRFVGNTQAGQTQGMNQMNRQGQNRAGGARRTGQNQNQMNQNQAGGAAGANQQRTVRPQLVVAFTAPRPTTRVTAGTLASRFDKLADRAGFEGVTIHPEGNKLILRGVVDSAETSRLAAALARMEPGVRSVQNELTVKSAPAAAGE